MEWLALAILVLCCLVGFAALFFTTFGTLIILVGAILYALLTQFAAITVPTLALLAVFYLFGEVIEYLCIVVGAKRFGASNAAVIGALIGAPLGALLGMALLGIGVVLGALLGLFLGAFIVELTIQKDLVRSLKAGAGSLIGRAGSIAAKVVIAFVMFTIIVTHLIAPPAP